MDDESAIINCKIVGVAHAFGSLVRSRRKAMRMRQDQLALATGVGRRFPVLERNARGLLIGFTITPWKASAARCRKRGLAGRKLPADPGGRFLTNFLAHCAHGTNYVTGKTGSPLDFISFHAKGSPTFTDSHVRMGMRNQLRNIRDAFAVVASFPEYRHCRSSLANPIPKAAPPAASRAMPIATAPCIPATRPPVFRASWNWRRRPA